MAMAEDPVFGPVNGKDKLLRLAKKIKEDSPRSACVHNSILMHAKGYTDLYDVYMLKKNPTSNVVMLVDKIDPVVIAVYCPEASEGFLMDALNATTLIAWDEFNCVLYAPESLVVPLKALVEKKIDAEAYLKEGEFFIYSPEVDTMELEVPAGFTLKKISNASIVQMEGIAEEMYGCLNTETFRKLYQTAPSASVCRTDGEPQTVINFAESDLPDGDEEDTPLAWACSNREGQVGIVCCNETEISKVVEKGADSDSLEQTLTHLVTNALTLLMIKEGFIVHANVYNGITDIPSMTNWRKLGFVWGVYSSITDENIDAAAEGSHDADGKEDAGDGKEDAGDGKEDAGDGMEDAGDGKEDAGHGKGRKCKRRAGAGKAK